MSRYIFAVPTQPIVCLLITGSHIRTSFKITVSYTMNDIFKTKNIRAESTCIILLQEYVSTSCLTCTTCIYVCGPDCLPSVILSMELKIKGVHYVHCSIPPVTL